MKKPWIHYAELKKPGEKWTGTWCGKTAQRIPKTSNPNAVTCPRCIEEMKKAIYYCDVHGFLDSSDVRNDETCDYCGAKV